MKHKTILIILFVALAIAVIILFFVKKKVADKVAASNATQGNTPGLAITTVSQQTQVQAATPANPANTAVLMDPDANTTTFPLHEGSFGKAVKMLQAALNVPLTGIWDATLTQAFKTYYSAVPGIDYTTIAQQDFQGLVASSSAANSFPIQQGKVNGYVKDVQILLGISADGNWGPQTNAAVKNALNKSVITYADYINLVNNTLGTTIPVPNNSPYYNFGGSYPVFDNFLSM